MSGRKATSFLLLSLSVAAAACIDVNDLSDAGPFWDAGGSGGVTPDAGTSTDPITGGQPDAGGPGVVDSGASLGGTGGTGGLDSSAPLPDAGGQLDGSTPALDAGDAQANDASASDASAADASDAQSDAQPADASTQTDAGDSGTSPQASCLDGITNYGSVGPFKYTTKTAGNVKFWVPTVPAGCKVPVVHLANGTLATCNDYLGALERLASHGFLTACYEDARTGAGTYGITAFETAFSMFPELADKKLGSTGHSQGGQASLVTTQLAEAKWGTSMIYAALAMQPASGYGEQPVGQTWQQSYAKIKAPVFMFSGNTGTGFLNSSLIPGVIPGRGDGLVGISWVQEGFDALNDSIEAYHWLADGSTHIPTPVPEEQQISIPWFRWKLLGDKAACAYFKKMPMGGKWKVEKEQNAKPCQ